MDSVLQVKRILAAMAGMYATVSWRPEAMAKAADAELLGAVDLADWLVAQGMPFRAAHAEVGALVRASVEEGRPLSELVSSSATFGPEAAALLAPGASIARRTTPGGANEASVIGQRATLSARLSSLASRAEGTSR